MSSRHGRVRLDWCSYDAAKFAVEHWHYSRRMPASKLARIGVWEDGRFIGVIIYGGGATHKLGNPYGLEAGECCELVRVALRAHLTPVSRMIAQSLRMLKRQYPGLKLVISFADPYQGHLGGIYKAGNWIYLGETAPERMPILDGRVSHPRSLSDRVRTGKVSSRRIVPHVRRPGKHRYAYPLDNALRVMLLAIAQPYPKASEAGDGVHQAHSGGATPTRTLHTPNDQRPRDSKLYRAIVLRAASPSGRVTGPAKDGERGPAETE